MQPLLPQVIVGPYHVLRLADVAAVQPRLPPNVFMLRRQSAWVNVHVLVEIMRLLGRCLGPILYRWQPMLLMDTTPVHCARACLRAATTAGPGSFQSPRKQRGSNNLWAHMSLHGTRPTSAIGASSASPTTWTESCRPRRSCTQLQTRAPWCCRSSHGLQRLRGTVSAQVSSSCVPVSCASWTSKLRLT